jgi:hypothetical protein
MDGFAQKLGFSGTSQSIGGMKMLPTGTKLIFRAKPR